MEPPSETAVSGAKITVDEFRELAFAGVPFVAGLDPPVERFEAGEIAVRLPYQDLLLRPGGTLCGPARRAGHDLGAGQRTGMGYCSPPSVQSAFCPRSICSGVPWPRLASNTSP